MSHRSYRSTEPDPVELEPSEPSLQNNQDSLRYDLPDQPQEEEPSKVQGFFGVVPWSIKLSPGKVAPLADISTLDAGGLQLVGNVIWLILFGWWVALFHVLVGALMFITIVGIPYGKFAFVLAKYWLWPYGKYLLGPHNPSESTPPTENSSLLGDSQPATTTRQAVNVPLKTNKVSAGYFIWVVLSSLLLAPIHLLSAFLNWTIVLSIPMAKTHWTVLRAIYEKPLDIVISNEYGPGSGITEVVLCTYNAYSLGYIKYTFMGLNIFLCNLFPVLFLIAVLAFFRPDSWNEEKPEIQFVFYLACCIPITFYIGVAISCIAAQTNYMIGALLNASFGSMTELILYGTAILRGHGLDDLVKYSVTGGLLSDTLLLPGLAMVAGGIKYKDQKFNPVAAGASSLMLFIAVVGVFSPTIWYEVYGGYNQSCNQCQLVWGNMPGLPEPSAPVPATAEPPSLNGSAPNATIYNVSHILCNMCYKTPPQNLDADPRYHDGARYLIYFIAAILPVAYIVGLLFTFFTHSHIFQQEEHGEEEDLPSWGLPFAAVFMMINTLMFGLLAESIVGVVQPTLKAFGLPQSFVGLTLMALVPATTEIVNAVKFALVNQISLSVEIGSASAIQISLIQVPFLVVISAIKFGTSTTNAFVLIFPLLTVFAVLLAVITSNYIAAEGRTSYFTGTALIIIYLIFIASFFFVPQVKDPLAGDGGGSTGGHSNVVMTLTALGRLGGR